jgi:hypothetical protein
MKIVTPTERTALGRIAETLARRARSWLARRSYRPERRYMRGAAMQAQGQARPG